jgi:pimeloyl-ACP methyl ester carboxylesterase
METMQAQAAAIGAWGRSRGERFARLRQIKQPALVFNGNDDIMIPTRNSFLLSQHLPNALLIIYPDSGHGALFQYAVSFTRHATEFLDSEAGIPGI